jgi:hypothetical protein
MVTNASILIPDISGYTEFLTQTELDHSAHILSELLELLAGANTAELTLSEVEGDALLFYRKGKPIELALLIRQCTAMFEIFHARLRIIERDSICPCGACQGASNLSLKFIVHYGPIKELRVSGFTKAAGVDMVIAHRLLKNKIDSSEYILITQKYLHTLGGDHFPSGLTWLHASEEYPAVGKVEYQYASLEPLKDNWPLLARRSEQVVALGNNTLKVEIAAPRHDVYRALIDTDTRSNWFIGSKVKRRDEVTERIGMKHLCLYRGMMFEITIAGSQVSESESIYVENVKSVESKAQFQHTYILRPVNDRKTLLTFDLKQIDGPELPEEMLRNTLTLLKANLEALKFQCEK